ncbi:MAG TPA: transaldolase family protein [Spirochaetia bacterium]|nr:transaldolase family protein [Spirochaetia bacterium]
MHHKSYLDWVVGETSTTWWHDSGNPAELEAAIEHGAAGVTTNPVLTRQSLSESREYWRKKQGINITSLEPTERAEALTGMVARDLAARMVPEFERSGGAAGYVCAQVNPALAGNRESMLSMARRFHEFAPNIAVKLPVTAAGLDVLEECTSQGITVTATVSFTVPQVIAIAESHRRGIRKAESSGIKAGRCFAVIMIGRLDDYLRDLALDSRAPVEAGDLTQAGLAVTKRAYTIYKDCDYEAVLLVAALRGNYHMTELAGGELIMSIHPKSQKPLLSSDIPMEERIQLPISGDITRRLSKIPDFIRAYEPEGMKPEEFISFGVTQRTLTQFYETGWRPLETYEPEK